MTNAEADNLIATLPKPGALRLYRVGDQIVMDGAHAISAKVSSGERLLAHRKVRTLQAGLPATWWIGYDAKQRRGLAQEAEPLWITDDPEGEDPSAWQRIDRDEIANILAEGA
jgi:hypothetical protein